MDDLQNTRHFSDSIAIIGMAGRFPGARNLADFWNNLCDGVESISCFSDDELRASGVDPEWIRDPAYVNAGAIVDDVERFDADFFAMTSREAELTDPQHRIFLECAWEALEHAGYSASTYRGLVGVYAGSRISEYLLFNQEPPDLVGLNKESLITNFQRLIANDKDYLATRVSYKFNLKGPSITVQTACSTSLVAVHLASQSLLNGECDLALAGGVSIRIPQKAGYPYQQSMIFSPDGHTRAFDAQAAGTLFGSGAGIVVLKRLEDALADRDQVHAVIRGSAVNNDGSAAKSAYSAPSVDGQAEVIAQALSVADVEPASVSYIEAHGTATPLGDAIEIAALTQAFRAKCDSARFCAIGSVKTNIGHLVQAAGVAGLIKTVLMLKHKLLVPSLHFNNPNPQVDFLNSPFYVNTTLTKWPAVLGRRRAGVSSFGVGGTNAHVILEEAPNLEQVPPRMERPLQLLCLSAKNEPALEQLRDRYATFFAAGPRESLGDICYTANAGRAHFNHRLAVIAESSVRMNETLAAPRSGLPRPAVMRGQVSPERNPRKLAFLFTGQGSQYIGMGRQLYDTEPTFREAINRCAHILRHRLDQPLLSILYPDSGTTSLLDETAYTQPALFVLEYALAQLWQSWGIKPALVMGHSVGEYAAACVAGLFSLEDGLYLAAERGRMMQSLPRKGEMAVVFAPEPTVASAVKPHADKVSIAAINGPEIVVISGEYNPLRQILSRLERGGFKSRRLKVSHAFHSPLMEPILNAFEEKASRVTFSRLKIEFISNLTGDLADEAVVGTAAYWRRHIREPVRFSGGMKTLVTKGCEIYLEIGPKPVLVSFGRKCVSEKNILWLASLKAGLTDWEQILESLGSMYIQGVDIDWLSVDRHYNRHKVELPTYPFQRKKYWIESIERTRSDGPRALLNIHRTASHPLLGRRLRSALKEIQFESRISILEPSFLGDHCVRDAATFPASAYVEMVLAAAREVFAAENCVIEKFVIHEALILPAQTLQTVQLVMTPENTDEGAFQIFSSPADGEPIWRLHASGNVRVNGTWREASAQANSVALETVRSRCANELSVEEFYSQKRAKGMQHGPAFQGIERLWRGTQESLGRIRLPKQREETASFLFHPALLDACLQVGEAGIPMDHSGIDGQDTYVPMIAERIRVHNHATGPLWSYARIRSEDLLNNAVRTIDYHIFDETGNTIVEIEGLHFKRLSHQILRENSIQKSTDALLYEVDWQPRPLSRTIRERENQIGSWIIFADQGGVGAALARYLEERRETCHLIVPGKRFEAGLQRIHKIDPKNFENYPSLLEHVHRSLETSCRGIVHLWSLDVPSPETSEKSWLLDSLALSCGSLLHLVQNLVAVRGGSRAIPSKSPRLWLVSRGAEFLGEGSACSIAQAPLWGFGRVIMRELPQFHCSLVDLDPSDQGHCDALFDEIYASDSECQIAFRRSRRHTARLVQKKPVPAEIEQTVPQIDVPPFKLEVSEPGIIDNLIICPTTSRPPGPGKIQILVHRWGLNFRDVLTALGQVDGQLGFECAGIIAACGEGVTQLKIGDPVLAVQPDSFRSPVTVDARFVAPKPDNLSLDEAVTIPMAFLTAHYGLHRLAKVRSGERILIHSAAGGVGLAAVQIGLRAGAEIFATASPGKWEYLKSLGISHVFNSRSLEFAQGVMEHTRGQGVDIVLNSLSGDFIGKSLSVLTPKGRFVELGVRDVWDANRIAQVNPGIQYYHFRLSEVARQNPDLFQAMFHQVLQDFAAGALKPLPRRVFPLKQASTAMRFMAQAKHVGKIVLSRDESVPRAVGKTTFAIRGDSSYLITGGLGGLGSQIARWLAAQGARHLVLVGRRPPSSNSGEWLNEMQHKDVRVSVFQADVSQEKQLAKVLHESCASLPPLRGVVHAAGIHDDGMLQNQTWDRFTSVMAPKIHGAWNLHCLTRDLPLDFLVLFSSISSIWGTPGQGNYAAANAFMDALAHYRRSLGLTAVSINWSSWAQVGMAAALSDHITHYRATRGLGTIGVTQGLQTLGQILQKNYAQVGVIAVDWRKYLQQFPDDVPLYFSELVQSGAGSEHSHPRPLEQARTENRLRACDRNEHHDILVDRVRSEVARVLGVDKQDLDVEQSLNTMGLDSLTAIELQNRIRVNLGVDIAMVKLLGGPSITKIAALLLDQLVADVTSLANSTAEDAITKKDFEKMTNRSG